MGKRLAGTIDLPEDHFAHAFTRHPNMMTFGVKQTPGDGPSAIDRVFTADITKTVGENVIASNFYIPGRNPVRY